MSLVKAGRPEFPNERRDLSPELARVAVFIIAIGFGPEADRRLDADKIIAGCESGACLIQTREAANGETIKRRGSHNRQQPSADRRGPMTSSIDRPTGETSMTASDRREGASNG